MYRRFLRDLIHEVNQHIQSFLVAVQCYQYISLLEFIQWVFLVDLLWSLKPSQSFSGLVAVMLCHAHVSVENWRPTIDLDCTLEELSCLLKLLLLQTYVTQAPPCIVMSLISSQGTLVTFLGLVEVFVSYVFMAAESMRVSEIGIQLNGSAKEFECGFMFLLQWVTVTHNTPCLRRE